MTTAIAKPEATEPDAFAILAMPPEPYSVGKIKEAGGEETPRFCATVFKGATAIAEVSNDGNGGCCRWYFRARAEEQPFKDWIKANHPDDFEPEDGWVYRCMDRAALLKELKRAARKATIFRKSTDKAGEYSTVKLLGPDGVRWVKAKYPGAHVFDPATERFMVPV